MNDSDSQGLGFFFLRVVLPLTLNSSSNLKRTKELNSLSIVLYILGANSKIYFDLVEIRKKLKFPKSATIH